MIAAYWSHRYQKSWISIMDAYLLPLLLILWLQVESPYTHHSSEEGLLELVSVTIHLLFEKVCFSSAIHKTVESDIIFHSQ